MLWIAFEDRCEDRVFVKTIGWPIDCLRIVSYDMEISFVMGNFIGIVDTRIARASLEVPSVLFEPGTDLYGCVSDITLWDVKLVSIKYISIWWWRIYSFSLTPFSETYELRGYVVDGYQWYISNLVMWHTKCCWSFVDQSVTFVKT